MSTEDRPSGLLAGQTDPEMRQVFQSIGDGLRDRYGLIGAEPPERTTLTGVPPSPRVVPVPSPPPVPHASTPPLAERRGEGTPLRGQAWRDAMKAATSRLHAAQRNRRGKPREKPIVGVRAAQRPRGEER
jgi:hypothetical protein